MMRATLTLVFVALACAPQHRLFGTQQCGNRDFNGTYGILARGAVTVTGFPITGPFARAGQVQADGIGNAVFHTTASYNGFLFSEAITAKYTVAPDCTIVFNVDPFAPIGLPATFNGVLSDNKREVDFMIVNPPGQTISAVLKKQDGACHATNLAGSYLLHLRGDIVAPATTTQPSGQFVRLGRFIPDGGGNFTAETTANYDGLVIQQENFSGVYTVTKDCVVSIQYTFQDVVYTWSGSLVENGKSVDLIVGLAGYAVNGVLQQQ